MQRTQILLEEWQYHELKKVAAMEKTSLSGAVRSLLSRLLTPQASEKERRKIVGFIKGGPPMSGKDHDRFIYREDWREK